MTCKNKTQSGGCPLPNIHCRYPGCEQDCEAEVVKVVELDYVIIQGMHFSHSEILAWREEQCARRDQHFDDRMIDVFAQAMKNKMAIKRDAGWGGWNSDVNCTDESIARLLIGSVIKGDPVDIANYAMMYFSRVALNSTLVDEMTNFLVSYRMSMTEKPQNETV